MVCDSRSSISLFLLFLTSTTILFCSGDGVDMSCLSKLLPCEAALKNITMTPPPTCCLPLKEVIDSNPHCLCDALNNTAILKQYNITESQALTLPDRCNVKADLSVCNKTSTPPTPSTPSIPASVPHSGGNEITQATDLIAVFAALFIAAFQAF